VNVGTFHTIVGYAAGHTHILDGGNDMYDKGNCISVPATSSSSSTWSNCSDISDSKLVTYLQNCDEQTVNGQTYSMFIRNDSISVLYFESYTENTISVNGNLGADKGGSIASGSYKHNGWEGFWKVTWDQDSDPGVNHLWMTDAPNAIHTFDDSKYNDFDKLSDVDGYKVVYLMWATAPHTRTPDSALQELIEEISILN